MRESVQWLNWASLGQLDTWHHVAMKKLLLLFLLVSPLNEVEKCLTSCVSREDLYEAFGKLHILVILIVIIST